MGPYRTNAKVAHVARRWGATWWVKFVVGTWNGERSRIRRELRRSRERERDRRLKELLARLEGNFGDLSRALDRMHVINEERAHVINTLVSYGYVVTYTPEKIEGIEKPERDRS